MRRAVLVVALAPLLAPAQPRAPLTIDQLMSAPFPSEMTAAPTGGHVAWIQNAAGVRNVWVAAAPDYTTKAITAYKNDDGQEVASLAWTAAADALVYVRGSAANRGGEIPNPAFDPAGAEQSVWIVPAAGGAEPRRLGEGAAPAVSKSGLVAWIWKGQIWAAPADGGAKAAQLLKTRGTAQSLRWSPDGARLAFASARGDHSFIGVYDTAAKTVRYLDPGLDQDRDPAWSPDGKQIAFLRVAAAPRMMFGPVRAAEHPWSIRIADAATGQGKQVFAAEPGRGSAFQAVNAENQILWASTGHLVFPWERDGWLHLYSLPASGDAGARLLTFGEYEVEDARLAPDGREVIYSSNSDDIDRRHIFRVPAGGGPVNPVTSGKGIEWSPAMTSDGKAVAFLRSDARTPARAAIMAAFGAPRDLAAVDFPADALVEPQPVVINAADGLKIRAQLFLPSGGNGKNPAVAFFHGGSRRQMLLGWHYLPYYHATYAFNQYLASRGYVVLSVNYRSGIGYGMEFREALSYGASGASEFADVLGAGLYLQSRADVDPRRVGLWGGSYGGYLTAMGLARASDLFAAGVDIHGVHDWNNVIRNFNPAYDPLARREEARLAFDSSPMAFIKGWRSPVLLIHGDDDRNVPFSESVTLASALRRQGVEFEQLVFPDEVHGFLRHARWIELFRAAGDFLDRRLKGRK